VAISIVAVGKPEENGYAARLMTTIREEERDSFPEMTPCERERLCLLRAFSLPPPCSAG
jgi:hypothetical protein